MPTYTLKAPNGKTYNIEGPDGASQDDVQAEILRRDPAAATAARSTVKVPPRSGGLDTTNLRANDAKGAWETARADFERDIADLPETAKNVGRRQFLNDPKIKAIRAEANRPAPPAVSTKEQGIRDVAREKLRDFAPVAKFFEGLGVPQEITRAPDAITAATRDLTLGALDAFDAGLSGLTRKDVEEDQSVIRGRSNTGNIIGSIYGMFEGGKGIATAVKGAGRTIARPGANAFSRVVGNAVEASQDLKKGKTLTNAAKLSATGATFAGADAAVRGHDVPSAVVAGAVAGPALVGAGKVGGWLLKSGADILGIRSIGSLLRSVTDVSPEELNLQLARYRAQGIEPTFFELLPLKDQNRISKSVFGSSDAAQAATRDAAQARARTMGPELAGKVEEVTAPRRGQIEAGNVADQAAARGGAQTPADEMPGDYVAAADAGRSKIGAEASLKGINQMTMDPVRDEVVADSVHSIFPTALVRNDAGEIEEVYSHPEINKALKSAAGSLVDRLDFGNPAAEVSGITADDVTNILKRLESMQNGVNDSDVANAARAEEYLVRWLQENHPKVAARVTQMRASHAANTRRLEGMREGEQTRTKPEIPDGKDYQEVVNTYSREGEQGRFLGQANALGQEFGNTTPQKAVSAAAGIEGNQTALNRNLGPEAAAEISEAAATQTKTARALASLDKNKGGEAGGMNPDEIAAAIFGLNPKSMIRTKIWAMHRLTTAFRVSEGKAKAIVDLVLSQKPGQTQQAINMLNNAGTVGKQFIAQLGAAVAGGKLGESYAAEVEPEKVDWSQQPEAASAEGEIPASDVPAEEGAAPQELPEGGMANPEGYPVDQASPYAGALEQINSTESPELLDLIERVSGQESRGQHFGKDGKPKRSSAGAIGIMQVMPETAPEAAKLAGLPYDKNAYYNDPVYNKLLGIAYLSQMLREFDGDVVKAVAAYNAGPEAVRKYGGVPPYAETQEYVSKILG